MEDIKVGGFTLTNEDNVTHVKYEGNNDGGDQHVAFQATKGWSSSEPLHYFEVSIKSAVEAVGIGMAVKGFPTTGQMPGWASDSFGYHGDDGKRFVGGQTNAGWPLFAANDVAGLGLKTSTGEIFGTLNGKLLGLVSQTENKEEFFPTVGLNAPAELDVHFTNFKFDLSSLPEHITPIFGELGEIDFSSEKLLVLFLNGVTEGETEKMKKSLEEFAASAKAKYGYQSLFSSNTEGMAKKFRDLVGIHDRSPLVVSVNFGEDEKFALPEKESITRESLEKFLEDVKEGKLAKLQKSARRPDNDKHPDHPTLTQVVASSFDDVVIGGTKDVLLDVYADWCGPCRAIAPTLVTLSEIFEDNDNIVIAKIDCDSNDINRTYLPETSIPNIKLFRGNNKKEPLKYQGNRSLNHFLEFLHQNASVTFDLEAAKEKGKKLVAESQKKQLKNVKPIHSSEEFDTHVKSGKLVIVDYFADWCGPCKYIAPVYAKLSEKYTDVVFLKVDVDELQDVSKAQDISCMPTFKAYKDGVEIGKVEGADEEELSELVTTNLKL